MSSVVPLRIDGLIKRFGPRSQWLGQEHWR